VHKQSSIYIMDNKMRTEEERRGRAEKRSGVQQAQTITEKHTKPERERERDAHTHTTLHHCAIR
jgi:hypothetical protein